MCHVSKLCEIRNTNVVNQKSEESLIVAAETDETGAIHELR